MKGKGIDLKGKNLVKAQLYAADLRNSNLSQTNLVGAQPRELLTLEVLILAKRTLGEQSLDSV